MTLVPTTQAEKGTPSTQQPDLLNQKLCLFVPCLEGSLKGLDPCLVGLVGLALSKSPLGHLLSQRQNQGANKGAAKAKGQPVTGQ